MVRCACPEEAGRRETRYDRPRFRDDAPSGDTLTDYDRAHLKLYLRLLDAEADGADWREAVEILFGVNPVLEPERARRMHDTHLARAHWMSEHGYKILRRADPS